MTEVTSQNVQTINNTHTIFLAANTLLAGDFYKYLHNTQYV